MCTYMYIAMFSIENELTVWVIEEFPFRVRILKSCSLAIARKQNFKNTTWWFNGKLKGPFNSKLNYPFMVNYKLKVVHMSLYFLKG